MQDSLVAQTVKNLPAMQETWVWSVGQEDPLEKEITIHSSILAWRIPWTEEPGRLWYMGSQKVGHDWVTNTFTPSDNTANGDRDKECQLTAGKIHWRREGNFPEAWGVEATPSYIPLSTWISRYRLALLWLEFLTMAIWAAIIYPRKKGKSL